MTAGGPNEFGDDSKKNRFIDPATGEAYFLIIDKRTGKTKIYNEEFLSDKYIGEWDPETGKIKYNRNLWGGARKEERAFFNEGSTQQLIRNQAKEVIKNELVAGERTADGRQIRDPQEAAKEAANVLGETNWEDITEAINDKEGTAKEYGTGNKKDYFVYPETLRTDGARAQDTLSITMIEYRTSGFDKDSVSGVKSRGSITTEKVTYNRVVLPIPAAIRSSNSTDWSQSTMTAWQAAQADFLLRVGNKGVGNAIDAFKSKIDNANTSDVKKALLATLASGNGSTNDLLSRTSGAVLNPNMEALFKGPQLREFSFNFQLAPRNAKEAKTVLQIIRFFKQGMAPIRTEGNLFLKSPNIFELKYTHNGGEHKGLNKFKECALKQVNVDYTPEANYSTYKDGVMTSYSMDLSFQELEPIYNDDYGDNKGGVPEAIGF